MPPTTGERPALRDAAIRLRERLGGRSTVVLLDNAFEPEQVRWLVQGFDPNDKLRVVVAGATPVGAAFDDERQLVGVTPLDLDSSCELLRAALRLPDDGSDRQSLVKAAKACLFYPRVLLDVAAQLNRDPSWSLAGFVHAMDDAGQSDESPAVRVWRTALEGALESLPTDALKLLAALAGLPVTGLSKAALAELVPDGDLAMLRELQDRYLLRREGSVGYRMPEEIRVAVQRARPEDARREATRALPRLIDHYAEKAEGTASGLSGEATGASATAWFSAEERLLAALLASADSWLEGPALEPAFRGLVRIADALDAWYARKGDADGLAELATVLRELAQRREDDDICQLARLRAATSHRMAGRLVEAQHALRELPDELPRALDARRHNAWAMFHLAHLDAGQVNGRGSVAGNERLQSAMASLERCQGLLAASDGAARVSVRINLAVVKLRQGRLRTAGQYLLDAAWDAGANGDLSGRAHATELLGVAAADKDDVDEAHAYWREALRLFEELDESRGVARCRSNLGL